MDWQEHYRTRQQTAEQAARIVKDGDFVFIAHAGPRLLQPALYARRHELHQVRISTMAPLDSDTWYADPIGAPFDVEVQILLGGARPSRNKGVTAYLPNVFTTAFKSIDDGRPEAERPDVFICEVSEPNARGYVHFGPLHWDKQAYARRAKHVIAEVNPDLRYVNGQNRLHVSQFDAFVPSVPPRATHDEIAAEIAAAPAERQDELRRLLARVPDANQFAGVKGRLATVDLPLLRRALFLDEPTANQRRICEMVADLIPDGGCLQVGVGTPSHFLGVIGALDHKHDLGIHSEILPRGLARLVEQGVITGARKTLHPGKVIAVSCFGSTPEDMAVIYDNPTFELHDPEYVLDPRVMSRNDNLIAVNNALSIDLLGQINAETIFAGQMVGGTGGQPEAMLSAVMSKGGRAVSTLEATAYDGAVSRIVARHEPGTVVTIPRYYADTIVTEYGVARLMGKNERRRVQELIAIAHPDHRAELRRAAHDLFDPDAKPVGAGATLAR